ncbi:YidH family protein [Gordonia zhaorongruii]|uniref:YidH family protein n=1 Tax=Gordonia zhaorongruii TaxID=2597659 RepID=UPI00104EF517|nr:DUF202 domain-containing protein [Gordonia zhaorongruii]
MSSPHDPGTDTPPGAVDARFTLAAERTMLAWLRTALGLIAAGVAVLHVVSSFTNLWLQTALGVSLLVLGAASAGLGVWRWQRVNRALRTGGAMPGPLPIWILIGALIVISLAFAVIR